MTASETQNNDAVNVQIIHFEILCYEIGSGWLSMAVHLQYYYFFKLMLSLAPDIIIKIT